MTTFLKFMFLLFFILIVFSCSSGDDDCTKEILVQPELTISGPYGTTFIPEKTQEVPCDFPEPEDVQPIGEGNVLNNFAYEVIRFVYTPDTGNNTTRLQFEIKLKNNNAFIVRGNPILTMNSDNIQFATSYSADASNPCHEIGANSNCILLYDKETIIDENLGTPSSLELVSVKYVL